MGLFRTAVQKEHRQPDLIVRVPASNGPAVSTRITFGQDEFRSMLYIERRRAERAQKRYVLLLLDVSGAIRDNQKARTLEKITGKLSEISRETDVIGWYREDSIIGMIGTEIGKANPQQIRESISEKFRCAFLTVVGPEKASQIVFSFHFFPEEHENGNIDDPGNITLYPDLLKEKKSRKFAMGVKRAIDILGSACALVVLSPLFALIALAIKATSKGPVLFGQARIGHHGKKFRVWKFRSMKTNCDSRIHEEYVSRFIAGQVSNNASKGQKQVFKIQKDPRVTPVGRILRSSSLDELPQFWNVLVGQMSLVGPRPPVEYEFKVYDVWHRRRVMEIKPGITGLWQVEGRSRTQFDDMVRLDLKYARLWSIWLDLKILLRTPGAVVSGNGAH